jgi:hypothetical protein
MTLSFIVIFSQQHLLELKHGIVPRWMDTRLHCRGILVMYQHQYSMSGEGGIRDL